MPNKLWNVKAYRDEKAFVLTGEADSGACLQIAHCTFAQPLLLSTSVCWAPAPVWVWDQEQHCQKLFQAVILQMCLCRQTQSQIFHVHRGGRLMSMQTWAASSWPVQIKLSCGPINISVPKFILCKLDIAELRYEVNIFDCSFVMTSLWWVCLGFIWAVCLHYWHFNVHVHKKRKLRRSQCHWCPSPGSKLLQPEVRCLKQELTASFWYG